MTAPLHAVSIAGVQPSAWPPDDAMCLAGCERDSAGPGALVGGGLYCSFIEFGVFAFDARLNPNRLGSSPAFAWKSFGFRWTRRTISASATTPKVPCGTFLTKWGSSGGADDEFDQPELLAVDGSVSDFNNRVQKFACP